jgi:hypothetical protein
LVTGYGSPDKNPAKPAQVLYYDLLILNIGMLMKTAIKSSLLIIFLLLAGVPAIAQDDLVIMADQAIHHDGEIAQVCGIIAETDYARGSKGGPTYLNFTNPYPRQNFSVVIYKKHRKNFDVPPESLEGYKACAYGKIRVKRSRPQMEITFQDQLSTIKVEKPGE